MNFVDEKSASLPDIVRRELPTKAIHARVLQGPLREHLFQGTLDEIRPILAEEVSRTHLPAVLLSKDRERFSLVFEDAQTKCLKAVHNIAAKHSEKYRVSFCR